ncbi:hypothetical protein KC332_g8159 [Hortaea werneckii]|uniref:Uncharacterized protein n=1 Tax=Hortaea werneckii TaxID=91943 RepID=A0A3M7IZL1_HORWE|nr:hypothetical protein KC358_g7538 [Hortaea werneckii]KAI6931336.1 hypothetical protein KC348_g7306 [Hortaea werneckii]KAI6932687.1 hypothetical protein KC341_g8831 [Hortaea werneckii]KAI6970722.1 hypothetical protein KC321_g7166 [Hortaea werneckii]KAI6985127.1 hypothetical protein KC329_g7159 [Hortaea werneckii]
MPPAIADSDDDGDELMSDDDKAPSVLPGNNDVPALDGSGTNEQSTGSTERLQRHIRSAERALISPENKAATRAHYNESPTVQPSEVVKRRHTSVPGAGLPASSPEAVKRRKTVKTYGSKRPSVSMPADDSAFASLRHDTEVAGTSHSARYSEHSGGSGSSSLPRESLQADFLNHEPNEMFKDSGSTAVDNESSQQRMVAQALSDRKGLSTSVTKLLESDEDKSSSFPWTASAQTPAGKKMMGEGADSNEDAGRDPKSSGGKTEDREPHPASFQATCHRESQQDIQDRTENASTLPRADNRPSTKEGLPAERHNAEVQREAMNEPSWPEIIAKVREQQPSERQATTRAPRSSPIVQINTAAAVEPHQPVEEPSASAQKTTRGHKKHVQNSDTDPSNSDDIAVGLPRERYKPRPSKRRSTAIDDEPVDYSVRPEKAAKIKRNKTSNASAHLSVDHVEAGESKPKIGRAGPSPEIEETQAEKVGKNGASGSSLLRQGPGENSQAEATLQQELESTSTQTKSLVIDETQPARPSSKHQDRFFADEIKVNPTRKPTSASKKPSRAKTTLYEDHLDHDAAQRTPSLSQQQAHRKRAFKDITNQKLTSSTQRPEQSLVDHDEEEDELARDFSAAEPDGAKNDSQASGDKSQHDKSPKKRGRGRPPKRTATQRDRSTENNIDNLEAEEDIDGISGPDGKEEAMPKKRGRPPKKARNTLTGANGEKPDNRGEDEAIDANDIEHNDEVRPERKGRGRPPKVVIPVQSEQAEQSPLADGPSEQSSHPLNEPREKETGLEESLSNPIETNTSAKQAPTPSPEKSAVGKSTPPPNRASPTSHSPIKSSSKVPYRVGLSKRQKIPSLLRTMRPPKRTI